MQRVCFLVTLAILWVVILVAPVAAYPYEAGTAPGNSVSSHQIDSSYDGYSVTPYDRTASAKAEAKVKVYVYHQAPPTPRRYQHPRHTVAPPKKVYAAAPAKHKARPKGKQGKPFLTNKAGGSAFGAAILKSSIAVTSNGVVVKIMKGIMSGKPGSKWQFATPGHTLNIDRPIGSLLRFIIAVRNTDSSDLPTDGIYVSDDLVSTMNSKAENGALFMGGTKLRDLSDDELTQLTQGVKIPVGQYGIDSIPAKGTLGIRYDVRIAGGTGGPKDPGNLPTTGDNLGSTGAAGPSWWSKIDWGNIAFWAAIAVGCIIVLVGLIWLIRSLFSKANRPTADDDEPEHPDPDPDPIAPPAVPTDSAPPITPAWTEDEPALSLEDLERAAKEGAE